MIKHNFKNAEALSLFLERLVPERLVPYIKDEKLFIFLSSCFKFLLSFYYVKKERKDFFRK